MKVFIVFPDGRERNDEPCLGVYVNESHALERLGRYNRESNDYNDLKNCDWIDIDTITDKELGKAQLNDYTCITGFIHEETIQ